MSNAAQKTELVSMPVPQASESAAVVSMIERAARDVSMPIDRLEKLLELREKIEARNAERGFDEAMSLAQSEMRPVAADATNPQTKSKYASYPALDRALRPIYTKHGFALSFNTEPGAAADWVRVTCRVSHGGHSRPYQIDMPADGKGAKGGDVMTKTHATGSAVSYGMRYLLKMIFNISVGDDDDGNAAADTGAVVNEEQLEKLMTRIAAVGVDIGRYCAVMKVERVQDTRAKDFATAMKHLDEVERFSRESGKGVRK